MVFAGQKTTTLEEVQCLIISKEFQKVSGNTIDACSEGLNIRNNNYKLKQQQLRKNKLKKDVKGKAPATATNEYKETRTCHHCNTSSHIKKNCFTLKSQKENKDRSRPSQDFA